VGALKKVYGSLLTRSAISLGGGVFNSNTPAAGAEMFSEITGGRWRGGKSEQKRVPKDEKGGFA